MNEKDKKFKLKWLEKIKNVKHIEIYIAVIFIAILLLIYLSNFSGGGTKTKSTTKTDNLNIVTYVENLEDKLEDILSEIEGVSKVKVLITLNLAQTEVADSKINLNKFPEIKGVLVTGKGLNNTATKMKVLHAIEAVVEITNENIEILSSD